MLPAPTTATSSKAGMASVFCQARYPSYCGRVTGSPEAEEFRDPSWTDAIKEMNEAIASDEGYLSTILPIRDGVMIALRRRN